MNVDETVAAKMAWRPGLMLNYAVGLIEKALEIRRRFGIVYINSDDAPEWCLPGDKTTIGAATRLLLAAGVLVPFRQTLPECEIWGGLRKSSRECCNGHRNQLYELKSVPIAEEFLRRNPIVQPREQLAMPLPKSGAVIGQLALAGV